MKRYRSGAAVQWCKAVQLHHYTGYSPSWRGFKWCSGAIGLNRLKRPYDGSGAVVQTPAPTGLPVGCTTGAPRRVPAAPASQPHGEVKL